MKRRSQPSARGSALTYAGIFVLALATLMLEVLLTRITSVIAWYHLAFFVISLAMLGMTAGAVLVFCGPSWFSDADVRARLAQSALGFALAIPSASRSRSRSRSCRAASLMDFVALIGSGLAAGAAVRAGRRHADARPDARGAAGRAARTASICSVPRAAARW